MIGKEQIELPQFQTTKVNDRKAGMFEFEYSDTRGETRSLSYQLSPDFEGCMCFFPAWMRHAVYPFFGTDEERVQSQEIFGTHQARHQDRDLDLNNRKFGNPHDTRGGMSLT